MRTLEIVRCTNVAHKLKCMNEASRAVDRALHGPVERNGRKVTIRGEITDPCTCHIDALVWLATSFALERPENKEEIRNHFVLGYFLTEQQLIK